MVAFDLSVPLDVVAAFGLCYIKIVNASIYGVELNRLTCTAIPSIRSLVDPTVSLRGGLSRERRSWMSSSPEAVPTSNDAPSAVKTTEVRVVLKSIVLNNLRTPSKF